jgi:NCS1 family nucleobase:cation symporter-1
MLVWFGAAIAITEVWAGGLPSLTSIGLVFGIVAIVLGRLVGNGLMAAMARIGSVSALPTMVLSRSAFGVRGSYILAAFNVLQLVGWTGWMLFVGYLYLDILGSYLGLPGGNNPEMRYAWIILLGALCTFWSYAGKRFWQPAQRISSVLLFLLTVAMTAIVVQNYGLSQFLSADWSRIPYSGILGGADLVIAMSVSWLPLVADYSRYAKKPASGARGTFWGYFIGGTWMYAVGLLTALATQSDSPDQMVMQVMGSQGTAWAVAAVVLVLLSTTTTTFLDIFSAVVSTQNLLPRLSDRAGSVLFGVLGIGCALALDVFAYEPFLLAIGAIFLPAFTIVLVEHYLLAGRKLYIAQLAARGGSYWFSGGFNWRALIAWAIGFVVYDWAGGYASIGYWVAKAHDWFGVGSGEFSGPPFAYGSSLPCIFVTAVIYWLIVAVSGSGVRQVVRH